MRASAHSLADPKPQLDGGLQLAGFLGREVPTYVIVAVRNLGLTLLLWLHTAGISNAAGMVAEK